MESHWGCPEGRKAFRKVTWKVGTLNFRWGWKITEHGLRPVLPWNCVLSHSVPWGSRVRWQGRVSQSSNSGNTGDWLGKSLITDGFGIHWSKKKFMWKMSVSSRSTISTEAIDPILNWMIDKMKKLGCKTLPQSLPSASIGEYSYLPIAFHPDNSESTPRASFPSFLVESIWLRTASRLKQCQSFLSDIKRCYCHSRFKQGYTYKRRHSFR